MSSRTSACTPAAILSCSIMRSITCRCVYNRRKKEKTEERRKNERTLLFRLTLIVNVEDRRQSRKNDNGEEKQRKRKCNRFPASDRTRKISSNTSNRMVVVMVSSIACVGYFGDQLECIYIYIYERRRERERANIWKRKAIALCNCYSSIPHHNQF